MARYIDADKQIERYSKKLGFYIDEEGEDRFSAKCEEIRAAISALYNAPTADVVEVVHGEWICLYDEVEGITDVTCSVCKSTREINGCYVTNDDESCYYEDDYCPNCGAKMDGKKVQDDL